MAFYQNYPYQRYGRNARKGGWLVLTKSVFYVFSFSEVMPMRIFASSDLQRNPAEIQKAALMEPVFLSYHDTPRYVMMSLEEYVRLKGASIVAAPESFPESVIARIREIADSHPEIEHEIGGGLAALLNEPEGGGGYRPR
jgi:hypothetical protein